jgi:poly [ADP-ribose] polymerase
VLKAFNLCDPACPAFPAAYAVVRSAVLNKSDLSANSNKFYALELQEAAGNQWRLYTHYGRVGAAGVREGRFAADRAALEAEFDRLVREKTGRGYVSVAVSAPLVGSAPLAKAPAVLLPGGSAPTLDPAVARFVERVFHDSKAEYLRRIETPLGALSKEQIERGRQKLREIRFAIARKRDGRLPALSSEYYSLVPHRFGAKIDPAAAAITTVEKADDEEELLQLMTDVHHVRADLDATPERKYRAIGAELTALDPLDPEARNVVRQIEGAQSRRHGFGLKVGRVFRVCVPDERVRFDHTPGNLRLLFHGSRSSNIMGILSRGLLIAPRNVAANGYMFGKGIYFADQSTKSALYTSLWGDEEDDDEEEDGSGPAYLFLADVALGRIKKERSARYYEEAPPGFDSVQGCKGWSLAHNEYIIYRKEQATLRYVAEIRTA